LFVDFVGGGPLKRGLNGRDFVSEKWFIGFALFGWLMF